MNPVPGGILCRVGYRVGFMRVRGCVEARWGLLCGQDVEPGVRYKMVWLDNGSDDIAHKCAADVRIRPHRLAGPRRMPWRFTRRKRGEKRGVCVVPPRGHRLRVRYPNALAVVSRAGSTSHKGTKSKTYP